MADSIEAQLKRFRDESKLFSSLDQKGITRLVAIAQLKVFNPNDTIVEKGQAADAFYIVVKGGVRVIADGREEDKEVARLGMAQFFGEMGILNDEPRTASVRAIGETHCLRFEKEAVLAVLQDYPHVMHGLGSVGVERAGKLADAEEV